MKLIIEKKEDKKPASKFNAEYEAGKQKRIARYRSLANMKDEDVITKDNIDDWALNRVTMESRKNASDVRAELLESSGRLTEADTIEDMVNDAEKKLDAEAVDANNKGIIEAALDKALRQNRRQIAVAEKRPNYHPEYQNILLVGGAGTGKTERVKSWARENGINLLTKSVSVMDDTDLGGALAPNKEGTKAIRLTTDEFKWLEEKKDSVLFLDEFNRGSDSVRGTLLKLITEHTVPDNTAPGGAKFIPNFLFTIAAINPAGTTYNTNEMDPAERSRFRRIDVVNEPRQLLRFLDKHYTEEEEGMKEIGDEEGAVESRGRRALANALLSDKRFAFDTEEDAARSDDEGNGLTLTSRTLKYALDGSDGTKEDLLSIWDSYCNSLKKPMVEDILMDYKDINDKANAALAGEDSDSDVFKDNDLTSMVRGIFGK